MGKKKYALVLGSDLTVLCLVSLTLRNVLKGYSEDYEVFGTKDPEVWLKRLHRRDPDIVFVTSSHFKESELAEIFPGSKIIPFFEVNKIFKDIRETLKTPELSLARRTHE